MEINKELLKEFIDNKSYTKAIETLSQNIKKILISKVKEKEPGFQYVNLPNLRSICLRLLDDEYILIVEKFCKLHLEDVNEEYKIIKLMDLLKELNN